MHSGNSKTPMWDIEDDLNRKIYQACELEINIVKKIILPKAIYILNAVFVKNTKASFHRTRTNNSNILMEI